MANIKRGRKPIRIRLGKVQVSKKIVKDTEKIILKRITPLDHYVAVGRPRGLLGAD